MKVNCYIIELDNEPTWWRGLPTMEGNTARGASSPAKPALHIPDPLSTTKAATSSSILNFCTNNSQQKVRVLSSEVEFLVLESPALLGFKTTLLAFALWVMGWSFTIYGHDSLNESYGSEKKATGNEMTFLFMVYDPLSLGMHERAAAR